MTAEARVRAAFEAQGLMRTIGAEVVSVAPGEVVLRAPITPVVSQHDGFAHAALAFALGDNAAGFATLTLLPPDKGVLTVEMKINLVAPARGLALTARGRVEHAGRRLTAVRAEVTAEREDGTVATVALLQGTRTAWTPR